MKEYIPIISVFEQNGQSYVLSWKNGNLPPKVYYEIEDEYGRIIDGEASTATPFSLPKLGAGYYRIRLKEADEEQTALLIISPQQAFSGTKIKTTDFPIRSFEELKNVLEEKADLHYQISFPQFSDLLEIYNSENIQADQTTAQSSDYALYLALKSKYNINRNFQDWSNNCYEYNKINSYKCKEFSRKRAEEVRQAENVIMEAEDYLRRSIYYLHNRGKRAVAYLSMPLAVKYQSFEGWRDRKILLSKRCQKNQNYVPYAAEELQKKFYNPLILKVRESMRYADTLVINNFENFEKNICTDFPFSDREEKYDTSVILAILKIESRRHQCPIMAKTTSTSVSEEFLAKAQQSGIIFL